MAEQAPFKASHTVVEGEAPAVTFTELMLIEGGSAYTKHEWEALKVARYHHNKNTWYLEGWPFEGQVHEL